MQIKLLCLVLLSPFIGFAQSNWATKFFVKTSFEVGESKRYKVNELFKIDHLFYGTRSEVKSTVVFQVIDTSAGGFWIHYSANSNLAQKQKDASVELIASLTNGINLLIYAKNGYSQLDSITYFSTKARIASKLDSIAAHQTFENTNKQFIKYLQNELNKDAGLEILLAPLIAFETYYSSEYYSKFRISSEGRIENILNKALFPGNTEREWKNTSKDNTLNLNFTFTGHPVTAAQYFKSIYDPILNANKIKRGKYYYPPEVRYIMNYTFKIRPNDCFPKEIHRKTVSEFLFRSVGKMEMKALFE